MRGPTKPRGGTDAQEAPNKPADAGWTVTRFHRFVVALGFYGLF